jgi:hypothetical protein
LPTGRLPAELAAPSQTAHVGANEVFGTPLTATEKDQLVREGITGTQRDHTLGDARGGSINPGAAVRTRPGVERDPPVDNAVQRVAGRRPAAAEGREILELRWTARDQRMLDAFAFGVRHVWPLLPARMRYQPRAYAAIRRAATA